MIATAIRTRLLSGFDDPSFGREQWERLLQAGETDVVFLTWEWQRVWWESFGRGELLLIVAERDGKAVALAPFYTDEGMIYFVGSGGSDYLDFIGDTSEPQTLDALLKTAQECVPHLLGFEFYMVLDSSPLGRRLKAAAARLGFDCCDRDELVAPVLDLAAQPEATLAATRKKSLLAAERFFRRAGALEVTHLRDGEAILPQLEEFFEQHRSRWSATPYPSCFHDLPQCAFYQRLTQAMAHTGWLRFTRITWEGRPLAFHFGFCYRGSYLFYKPSFAIELARHSPGQVLLRQVLLAAIEEGARNFDFGIGDEGYKNRFTTVVNRVRTWGLYPIRREAGGQ